MALSQTQPSPTNRPNIQEPSTENQKAQFNGCELGWYRYQTEKCVNVFDTKSSYDEGNEYCKRAFGAKMLNITSDGERKFWSFHLMRYSNISSNVWLEKQTNYSILGVNPANECLALRSVYSKDHGKVGQVMIQNCDEVGATVCEIRTNTKTIDKMEAKVYDLNDDYIPNERLDFSDDKTVFFSGTYYLLISKFKNKTFSNKYLGHVRKFKIVHNI